MILEQSVITLSIEQPVFIKTRSLKTVVNIGGDNKIILVLYKIQYSFVQIGRNRGIPVDPDIAAPESPLFFRGAVRIKTAGIHIGKSVFFSEIRKVLFKPFAAVSISGSRRKTGTGSDDYGICIVQCCFQFCYDILIHL